MHTTDAITLLTAAFSLDGVTADVNGNAAYHLSNDFHLVVTELDGEKLRLSTQLSRPDATLTQDILLRALEAGYLGVETGAGTVATDPLGGTMLAYVDVVTLTGLNEDALQERVVDFILYAEYLRSEVIAKLASSADTAGPSMAEQETVIRA